MRKMTVIAKIKRKLSDIASAIASAAPGSITEVELRSSKVLRFASEPRPPEPAPKSLRRQAWMLVSLTGIEPVECVRRSSVETTGRSPVGNCAPHCAPTGVYPRQTLLLTGRYRETCLRA